MIVLSIPHPLHRRRYLPGHPLYEFPTRVYQHLLSFYLVQNSLLVGEGWKEDLMLLNHCLAH